jgi:hypothetical protein
MVKAVDAVHVFAAFKACQADGWATMPPTAMPAPATMGMNVVSRSLTLNDLMAPNLPHFRSKKPDKKTPPRRAALTGHRMTTS